MHGKNVESPVKASELFEGQLATFFAEARSRLQGRMRAEDDSLASSMGRFFADVQFRLQLSRRMRQDIDVYAATEFSVFRYLTADEALLSDIIADLLDPNGAHSQGDVFLRHFLEMTDRAGRCRGVLQRVVREPKTTHIGRSLRRIDLLLDFGETAMAIENKPWAIEQEDQIGDYIEHLEARYGPGRYLVVFLSGSGARPQSLRPRDYDRLDRGGQLITVAYTPSFVQFLRSCWRDCRADRVRWFLDDFGRYVEETFSVGTGGANGT
jgi:hypothetical protein